MASSEYPERLAGAIAESVEERRWYEQCARKWMIKRGADPRTASEAQWATAGEAVGDEIVGRQWDRLIDAGEFTDSIPYSWEDEDQGDDDESR